MVQGKKTKHPPIAVVQIKRTTAIFIFDAKTAEISLVLQNNQSTCLNSLTPIPTFKKDAAPATGRRPSFARQKTNTFTSAAKKRHRNSNNVTRTPSSAPFVFNTKLWNNMLAAATIIDESIISTHPYSSRAPPLLKSRFYQISERGGLPYGKTISQKSRTL